MKKEQSVLKTFVVNTRRGGLFRFAVSPDGTRVAGGNSGGLIMVWDVETGAKIELKGHPDRSLHALAFSPDGSVLASAAEDGKVLLWNPRSGEVVKTLRIGPSRGIIKQLAFSSDNQYLITVNGNGTVYVLDIRAAG